MSHTGFWPSGKKIPIAIAIIQARLNSSRLPGKVMMDLCGKPVLKHVIDRLKKCRSLHHIVVASPDKEIVDFAYASGIWGYHDTGNENDVLRRYIKAAGWAGAQLVVRVTGDEPLIDPYVVDECVLEYVNSRVDIVTNVFKRSYPKGMDVEVLHYNVLKRIYHLTDEPLYREHVTLYIYENPALFKIKNVSNRGRDGSFINVSIDTNNDLDRVRKIVSKLNEMYTIDDVVSAYEDMY